MTTMTTVDRMNTIVDRFLPRPEVLRITGFSSATLWREIQAERFPAPVPISPNRVGFLESEVREWFLAAKASRNRIGRKDQAPEAA